MAYAYVAFYGWKGHSIGRGAAVPVSGIHYVLPSQRIASFPRLASPWPAWPLLRLLRAKEPVDYVNPLIGAASTKVTPEELPRLKDLDPNFPAFHGKMFPGACTPDGMVQLSPDTITGGDNGAGYSYPNFTIQGFSFNHMSGVGAFGDLGNFMVMPTDRAVANLVRRDGPARHRISLLLFQGYRGGAGRLLRRDAGRLQGARGNDRRPAQRHPALHLSQNEAAVAHPDRPGPAHRRDVAAPDRESRRDRSPSKARSIARSKGGGFMGGKVDLHALLPRGVQPAAEELRRLERDSCRAGPYQRRSHPKPEFADACAAAEVLPGVREKEGQHLGFYAEFPTEDERRDHAQGGHLRMSASPTPGRTWRRKFPPGISTGCAQQARQLWANALSRISVEGGTEDQKTIFYTAMYHALIDPRNDRRCQRRISRRRRQGPPGERISSSAPSSAAGTSTAASSRC